MKVFTPADNPLSLFSEVRKFHENTQFWGMLKVRGISLSSSHLTGIHLDILQSTFIRALQARSLKCHLLCDFQMNFHKACVVWAQFTSVDCLGIPAHKLLSSCSNSSSSPPAPPPPHHFNILYLFTSNTTSTILNIDKTSLSQTHNSSLSPTAPSYPQHPHLQDFVQHASSHTNTFISRTTNRTPYLTVTNILKSNSKSIFTHHHHCATHIPKIYETLCRQTQNQILLLRDGSGYQNG